MTIHRFLFSAGVCLLVTATASTQETVPKDGLPLARSESIQPMVSSLSVLSEVVTDVRLRPLFTTTIRVPAPVTSVAVGAPTLFEAEHSEQEPRLVYVKPSTEKATESNLVITMQTGETITLNLISDGSNTRNAPVDFLLDYNARRSFFVEPTEGAIQPVAATPLPEKVVDPLERALDGQSRVATPGWQQGTSIEDPTKKNAPTSLTGALGEVRELNGSMVVAYSVRNASDHWIEVLPPQVELSNPGAKAELKKKDKKHVVLAEQIPITGFKVNERKLAPGHRADGVVQFSRPGFKPSQEKLLLQLASANSVDKPLLLMIPFIAPNN